MGKNKSGVVIDLKELKDKRRGTVSCCIITRDEAEFVAGAIESVRDLADEVIVVDTGSRDDTVAIARKCGARVYSMKWNNDFSEARNSALERATKEWILILDADEAIAKEDHERIRDLIRKKPDGAFLFDQWTYMNDSATFGWKPTQGESEMSRGALGYICNQQVRLFRNESFIRFRGEVHENVEADLLSHGVKMYNIDIVIHHYGRIDISDRIYRKHQMYLSLGERKLESNPRNTRYIYEMATQLVDLGHISEGAEYTKRGLELDPDNWELLNILGIIHLKQGDWKEAEHCFRSALKSRSDHPDLYNNLGVALIEQKDPAAALLSFEGGLEFSPDNANLLRNAASACLGLEQLDKASMYVTGSLGIDPFSARSHAILADIAHRRGDLAGAVESLGKIRFLPGTPLKVYLKTIHLYIQMRMVKEAGEIVTKALHEYTEHDGLLYLSGRIHELKGNDDEAISIYQRLYATKPGDADLANSIGCIQERRGNYRDALKFFSEAFRFSPFNLQVEMNLGIVMGKLGMDDEAEHHLRTVIQSDVNYSAAHNALGCHLAARNRYNEAIYCFSIAIDLEPRTPNYYFNLGLACEKLNMHGKAIEVYEKMAYIDPGSASLATARLQRLRETVM